MQTIGKFFLHNQGWFAVKIQFKYQASDGNWVHTSGTDGFPLGQSNTADPGDYGVPDGALVCLYAFVIAGSDNVSNQVFRYNRGSAGTASYIIAGTTLVNQLGLTSVS